MRVWAVIPVKPLGCAKSRLASVLNPAERETLVVQMFEHTLSVLCGWDVLTGVLVVSADPLVSSMAQRFGAQVLEEPDTPGLNPSLDRAVVKCVEFGADAVLVVAGDLPSLSRTELLRLFQQTNQNPCVVIAPDRHGTGTNVLYLQPPRVIPLRFGIDSYTCHANEAQKAGVPWFRVDSAALGMDVDLPEDLSAANAFLRK